MNFERKRIVIHDDDIYFWEAIDMLTRTYANACVRGHNDVTSDEFAQGVKDLVRHTLGEEAWNKLHMEVMSRKIDLQDSRMKMIISRIGLLEKQAAKTEKEDEHDGNTK